MELEQKAKKFPAGPSVLGCVRDPCAYGGSTVLELTFRCTTAPYDGPKQVGMIVAMSGQGLERRKDTGRSDPSRGGVGSIVRVNENWTAGESVRIFGHHDEIFFCALCTHLQGCRSPFFERRARQCSKKMWMDERLFSPSHSLSETIFSILSTDVEWHATGQIRQGYACGSVARGGKTRAFHLQSVPNNAILPSYMRNGRAGDAGAYKNHQHQHQHQNQQNYSGPNGYYSGQGDNRDSARRDVGGQMAQYGQMSGGGRPSNTGKGGERVGSQQMQGYGGSGGIHAGYEQRPGSYRGEIVGSPGLQLESQRDKGFVLPSQPEMVRG